MSLRRIIAALNAVLGAYAASPLLASAANDIYEAYLFSVIIEAARREGATVSWRDRSGNIVTMLRFRRSPGLLHTGNGFTHAFLEFAGAEALEVHVGVRIAGVSRVAHEADVAVLRHEECNRSRQGSVLPRSRGLIVALEAKYYASSVPLHLGRSFIGLGQDFRNVPIAFATNVVADSVVDLIMHHKNHAVDDVIPSQRSHNRLVEFVSGVFYKYRRSV